MSVVGLDDAIPFSLFNSNEPIVALDLRCASASSPNASERQNLARLPVMQPFVPSPHRKKVQVHLRQQLNILRKVTCIKEWSQVDFFPTRPPRTDQHGTESRQLLSFLLTKTFPFFSWFNATSSISMVKDGLHAMTAEPSETPASFHSWITP